MSAPGGPAGPGAPRPPTAIERRRAVNALRDRLRPNVTDRTLLETYLSSTDWDSDAAYDLWQADRARILSGRVTSSSSESDPENEDEDSLSSSSSSSPSSSGKPTGPPAAAAAGEEDDDEEEEKDGEDDGEEEGEEEESKTLKAMRGNHLGPRINANLEQERRDAALALRLEYESKTADDTTLSPSEAILLLHANLWDLGEAVDSFTTLDDIRLQLGRFDRMRTPLPTDMDPDEVDIMSQQDERLAEFINITGRPDWFSLRLVLQDHSWNLIEAVSFWFLRGVPPVKPPKRDVLRTAKQDPEGNRLNFGIRVGVNERSLKWPTPEKCEAPAGIFMDEGWGVEPDQYNPDDAADSEDDGKKGKKAKKGKKGYKGKKKTDKHLPEGFLISVDGEPNERAYKGCKNEAKFLVEHISRGKYTFKRFRQDKRFKWPDLDKGKSSASQSGRVLFDWNDLSHIQLLNNWRRQAVGRTIRSAKQDAGQHWSKEEDDYLIKLSEDLFEEKRRSSKKTKSKRLMVSTQKKDEWADDFNKKFSGTIQKGSKEPRTDRTVAAIMQRRSRIQELVDKFGVKPDTRYFAKLKQKAGAKRKRSDLSDDDDDDDDDAGQSKKTKTGEITDGEEDSQDNEDAGDEEEDAPMDISSDDEQQQQNAQKDISPDDDQGDAPMDLSD